MEIHRLKPMQEGYDHHLFNKIYKETESLRRLLSYQINHKKFGVTPDIVLSWFDDKFMFVFNKYYGKVTNDELKGFIINALKTFKFRVLRNAYAKHNIYDNMIRLEGEKSLINIIPANSEITNHELFLELALEYLKKNLCDDAFLVLEIELNPPPFILHQLAASNKKIPAKLIAEYLDLEPNQDSTCYINDLRAEVKYWVNEASTHFK